MKTIFTIFTLVIALSGCTSSAPTETAPVVDSTTVCVDTTKCCADTTTAVAVDTTAKK